MEWRGDCFVYCLNEKHLADITKLIRVMEAKPQPTPGSKATVRGRRRGATHYQARAVASAIGSPLYLALDRVDIQYSATCVTGDVLAAYSGPSLSPVAMTWAKPPASATAIELPTPPPAAARRCSLFHGPHAIDAVCAYQHMIALSSAEAELYDLGRLPAAPSMTRNPLSKMGTPWPPTPVGFMDSDAGRVVAMRLGVGCIRHLHVRCLWVQETVHAGISRRRHYRRPPGDAARPTLAAHVPEAHSGGACLRSGRSRRRCAAGGGAMPMRAPLMGRLRRAVVGRAHEAELTQAM